MKKKYHSHDDTQLDRIEKLLNHQIWCDKMVLIGINDVLVWYFLSQVLIITD